jgi:hypothetical protein
VPVPFVEIVSGVGVAATAFARDVASWNVVELNTIAQ